MAAGGTGNSAVPASAPSSSESDGADDLFISPDAIPARVAEIQTPSAALLRREHAIFFAAIILPIVGTVVGIARLKNHPLTSVDGGLIIGLFLVNSIGIEVGYHRLFTHHAFVTSTPVRVALAIAGAMAVQGPVMYWIAHHRRHHQNSDRPGDPHSPNLEGAGLVGRVKGLWHAHLGWIFSSERASAGYYARDILQDAAVSKVDRFYYAWLLLTLALPTLLGGVLRWNMEGAINGLLWGGFFRILLAQNGPYAINSFGHSWGSRPFESKDSSRNSVLFMLASMGGSLHNNHHAFPGTAKNSLRWFELDPGWWVIRTLQFCGLAKEIRVPSPSALQRRRRAKK